MDQSATAFKLFEDVHVVTGDESSTITQKGQLKGATSSKLTTGTDTKYYMVSPANFKTAVDTLVATKGIGVSQTWQDMSGSRAVSTVYQNTTGKPIQVNVDTNADVVLQLSADNSTFISVGTTLSGVTAIVPNNHYYKVNGSATVGYWAELR